MTALDLPGPWPDLDPGAVVAHQLAALQQPDVPYPDAGIEIAWAFSSPAYKEASGGLARFAALVHTAPLSDLLCFATAQHGLLLADGDHAEQEVVLARPTGATSAYTFLLTRQRSGPLAGCWMTDAMLRL